MPPGNGNWLNSLVDCSWNKHQYKFLKWTLEQITLNPLSNQSINEANRNWILQIHHSVTECSDKLQFCIKGNIQQLIYQVVCRCVFFTFHSSCEGQRLTARRCGIQNVLMCNNITLTQWWFRIRMLGQIGKWIKLQCLNKHLYRNEVEKCYSYVLQRVPCYQRMFLCIN